MERNVLRDNRGMTLIEVLFSLVILLIVSLALMQMALTGIHYNIRNVARDEAVAIAEMRMNQLAAKPFDDIELAATGASGVPETPIDRTIRKATVRFTPTRAITDVTAGDSKQITISLTWDVKGRHYSHSMTTIMRAP